MEKGDLVAIYLEGEAVLFCVVGLYRSEDKGEMVAVLALVNPKQLWHIPLDILQNHRLEENGLVH